MDADGDGLSNLQEYQSFTDPNKADTDEDGFNDYREFIAGTSGTNKQNYFLINIDANIPGANSFVLTWGSVSGREYYVLTCSNMMAGVWVTNLPKIVGDESIKGYKNVLSGPCNFFKVQVVKP